MSATARGADTPIYHQMIHDLAEFPAHWLVGVPEGHRLRWLGEVDITVTAIAEDGRWADLLCEYDGETWPRRLPIPVAAEGGRPSEVNGHAETPAAEG